MVALQAFDLHEKLNKPQKNMFQNQNNNLYAPPKSGFLYNSILMLPVKIELGQFCILWPYTP